VLRQQAGLVLDAMVTDFERATGPRHVEWVAVPEAFGSAAGALHLVYDACRAAIETDRPLLDVLLETPLSPPLWASKSCAP
jgi:3-carboxy-cis,cis-muconate cycloisomerase